MFTRKHYGDTNPQRGDERLFVTLLGFGLWLLAVASIWFTDAALAERDTLVRHVPGNAIVYFHGRPGASLHDQTSALLAVPTGLAPKEAARFAFEMDGDIVWAGLLSWGNKAAPLPGERRLLAVRGALELDDRTFLLAETSAISHITDTDPRWRLTDNMEARRSLAVMRDLTRFQGYFDPTAIPPHALPPELSFLKELEPTAFGINVQEYGLPRLLAMPSRKAAAYDTVLGFSLTDRPGRKNAGTLPSSLITLAGQQPTFDPVGLLFADIEADAVHAGLPPNKAQAKAVSVLHELLAKPFTLSLRTEEGAPLRFAVHLPDTKPDMLATAIADYLNSALPERALLPMPDNQTTMELFLKPGKYSFSPSEKDVDFIEIRDDAGDWSFVLAPDGTGGSILGSDTATVNASYQAENDATAKGVETCRTVTGISKITIRGLEKKIPSFPDIHTVTAVDLGDNILLACGY